MRKTHVFPAALVGVFALCTGCSDASGPTASARNDLPALIVSPIMHGGASASTMSSTTARATTRTAARASFGAAVSSMNAYVSLPPGSVPGGVRAAVRDGTAGTPLAVDMIDGGFDPVAITANVGDTLFVSVTRVGTAGTVNGFERVVAYAAPSVVRASPPRGTKDVALNATIVVVFSAPLDSTTVDTISIQLLHGTTPVAGTVRFADVLHLRAEFHPDGLLAPQTDYQLILTQAIRDVNGAALDSAVAVPFSTGTTSPATNLVFATVSAGHYHTCGVTSAGAAYCWGADGAGELGIGDTNSNGWMSPVPVAGGVTFAAVNAGGFRTCGKTSAGAAYCWGDNFSGLLGDGTTIDRSIPVPVAGDLTFSTVMPGESPTCGLTLGGAVYCWGDGVALTPAAVGGALAFSSVSAGYDHTCGVTTTGAAYCWGDNTYGQLGDGTTTAPSGPVLVAGGLSFAVLSAGEHHTCGITTANVAYCWGWNGEGQLGDGTATDRSSPALVAGGVSFAVLSAVAYQTCGVSTAGAAYCWGINGEGQLGDGTTIDRSSPALVAGGLSFASVSAGYFHTCGVTVAGAAYCWGDNAGGSLGDGTTAPSSVPVKVLGQP